MSNAGVLVASGCLEGKRACTKNNAARVLVAPCINCKLSIFLRNEYRFRSRVLEFSDGGIVLCVAMFLPWALYIAPEGLCSIVFLGRD